MTYHRSLGATAPRIPTVARLNLQAVAVPPVTTGGGSGIGGVVVLGGLAVVGYLVYRHFKKGTPP